jgi:glycosyltransferase involved in cell wall biosynthesis
MSLRVSELENIDTPSTLTPAPERRGLRVCMLVYSFYESDTRVLQYATALAKRGDKVDVIALRRNDTVPEFEILDGVNVYRIQSRAVNEKGLVSYARKISLFFCRAMFFLRRQQRKHPYDLVHVHNVPDFLVFAAIFLKRQGVPVILDIHDLLPEFYASKFKISHKSSLFKFLALVERWSASFADHVIIANHIWRERFVSRSAGAAKCSVVRNYPDLDMFVGLSSGERRNAGKLQFTYPGSLNLHQGLDVAIRAFACIADQIPEAEFHIYGEGPAKPSLIELTKGLNLQDRVLFHNFLPTRDIARVMANTDIAIEPKRATSAFGNEALSTKILEFMAVGVPVIASKTKIHAYYYDDSVIQYYENDDEAGLASAILRLRNDVRLRERLVANAKKYVRENNWDYCKQEYLQMVDLLSAARSAGTSSRVPVA